MSAGEALGATLLLTGPEDFLAQRTIDGVKAAIRSQDADADLSELAAHELGAGSLAEITSPSLFASLRCVVIRELETLPDVATGSLLAYVADPASDVALVLHHTGGVRGKAVLDKLREAGAIEIKAQSPKKWELPGWVTQEFRRYSASISTSAAASLVDALGEDLRGLAGAAAQLAGDAQGAQVTDDMVATYFGGRAEVTGFAVADAAIAGKAAEALEQLRWAFAAKLDPVLVTSAVAGGLRGVARYAGAPRGLREADLAREVGVPTWKLKTIAGQSRAWSSRGLAAAIQAAATADADVKGGADDRQWACERLVISVVRARDLR